jgi:signal transduction histidine kinase
MIEPQADQTAQAIASHPHGSVVRRAMGAAWRICGMGTRQAIWDEAAAELHRLTGAGVLCFEADRSGRLTQTHPADARSVPAEAIARRLGDLWERDRRPSVLEIEDGRLLAATCTDTQQLRGGLALIGAEGATLTGDDRAALALIALATGHTLGMVAVQATSVPLDRHEAALGEQRRSLSHTLHTGPAQDLAMATMALDHLLSTATVDDLADDARVALAYIGLAGENLRQFIAQLRGETPAASATQRKPGVTAPFFPGIGQEDAMIAIVREAIRNSRKHADASTIVVSVTRDRVGVSVQIEDDGQGFSGDPPGGHFGLVQMRDIAEAMGGDLAIESHPGQGTTIRFYVPEPTAEPAPPAGDHPSGDLTE